MKREIIAKLVYEEGRDEAEKEIQEAVFSAAMDHLENHGFRIVRTRKNAEAVIEFPSGSGCTEEDAEKLIRRLLPGGWGPEEIEILP